MSRNLTPLPARTGRAGTFDGMEKLFFDRAAAIEAGEMTAPPEVIGVPRAWWRRWLAHWTALALYQKIGIGAGAAVMVLGAVLTLGGGHEPKPPAPTLVPAPAAAAPAAAAPAPPTAVANKPTAVERPAETHRKPTRHARTKHARLSKNTRRR